MNEVIHAKLSVIIIQKI